MADLIFFALVAVFIAWRLKSVLGRNVEVERKRPPDIKAVKPVFVKPQEQQENVEVAKLAAQQQEESLKNFPSDLADSLRKMNGMDSSFSAESFVKGAGLAFEMVIKAISKGDERTLEMLLRPDILVIFKEGLAERKAKGLSEETTLIAIKSSEIVSANLKGTVAQVRVKFVSEQVKVTRDSAGRIVDGDPSLVEVVEDVWTFERDMRSGNPNWLLVETD